MDNIRYKRKITVLRKKLDEGSVREIIEEKKTSVFRSMLKKPPKDQVHLDALKLLYEVILIVSGKYAADYYRNAKHTINVDSNVKEVVIGKGIFPIKSKSTFLKKLQRSSSKNKVELNLDEHVFINEEETLSFDHHGNEIKFPFKINSETVENYPSKILDINEKNLKKLEISYEKVIGKFETKLKKLLAPNPKQLQDELTINEVNEVYVPIYEARLVGPKKKVELLRIDAIRKKII